MDEATRALAAEVVTLPGWRWRPGMRASASGTMMRVVAGPVARKSAQPLWLPDLDDAATLGCLLALVREAWREPGLVARFLPNWVDRDAMSVWRVTIPVKPPSAGCALWRNVARGPTEAHALVAALGAAPGHDSGHDPSKVAP